MYSTKTDDGLKGVGIGCSEILLAAKNEGDRWIFRLRSLHSDYEWLTGWVHLKEPGDLRTSRQAKNIRDTLKQWCDNESDSALERAIGLLQDRAEEFYVESGSERNHFGEETAEPELKTRRRQEKENKDNQLAPRIEPSNEDLEEAKHLLSDPSLLYSIKNILDVELTGEVENKLLCFLLGLSSKRPPDEKQFVMIKGSPSGGKSALGRVTTSPFKTKEIGRFSARAIEYSDLSQYDILYLKELFGEENTRIRFLSADDGGYIAEVTVKDKETDRFTTEEHRIPPITIFTTTAKVDVDQQFEQRSWITNVNETEGQTEAIWNFKASKEEVKVLRTIGKEPPRSRLPVLAAIVKLLEPCDIVVPYARVLTNLLNKTDLRSRRDYDKILELVKLSAFLHQKQRPKINETTLATLQDLYMSLKISLDSFVRTKSGLEKRVLEAIPAIRELGDSFTAKDFNEKLPMSRSYAYQILKVLDERGFLTYDKGERGLKIFSPTPKLNQFPQITMATFETLYARTLQNAFSTLRSNQFPQPIPEALLKIENLQAVDPIDGNNIILEDVLKRFVESDLSHTQKAQNELIKCPTPRLDSLESVESGLENPPESSFDVKTTPLEPPTTSKFSTPLPNRKDICGFCWKTQNYDILEANSRVERLGKVSEGNCQDCGKRPAEIRMCILPVESSGT